MTRDFLYSLFAWRAYRGAWIEELDPGDQATVLHWYDLYERWCKEDPNVPVNLQRLSMTQDDEQLLREWDKLLKIQIGSPVKLSTLTQNERHILGRWAVDYDFGLKGYYQREALETDIREVTA